MSESIRFAPGFDRGRVDFRPCRIGAAVVLTLLVSGGRVAYGQDSGSARDGDRPAAAPSSSPAVTLEELADRLRRLERQNSELSERNRSLTHELKKVTSRCDELNRRLEQIEPAARRRRPCPTSRPSPREPRHVPTSRPLPGPIRSSTRSPSPPGPTRCGIRPSPRDALDVGDAAVGIGEEAFLDEAAAIDPQRLVHRPGGLAAGQHAVQHRPEQLPALGRDLGGRPAQRRGVQAAEGLALGVVVQQDEVRPPVDRQGEPRSQGQAHRPAAPTATNRSGPAGWTTSRSGGSARPSRRGRRGPVPIPFPSSRPARPPRLRSRRRGPGRGLRPDC